MTTTDTPRTEDRLQKLERENAQLRAALVEYVLHIEAEPGLLQKEWLVWSEREQSLRTAARALVEQ